MEEEPRKTSLRQRVQFEGWQLPPGNLLQKYLQACERNGVVAITGVATQLLRRMRSIQPLPYQRTLGQDRQQLLSTLLAHLDPGATGQLPARAAELSLTLLNPRLPWRQALARGCPQQEEEYCRLERYREELKQRDALAYATYRHQLPPMPTPAFSLAAQAACAGVRDADVAQAVLECLALPVQGACPGDIRDVVRGLFRHLDVSSQGIVCVEDLVLVSLHMCPCGSRQQLIEAVRAAAETALAQEEGQGGPRLLLEQLQRKLHETMDEDTFVSSVCEGVLPLSGLSRDQVETEAFELMTRRFRPLYRYDFSRDYPGARGLLPLLEALRHDPTFVSLNLSGCGVTDSTCSLLCDWLKDHPSITCLDLSHNPIGDTGGLLLAALLSSNPRISSLSTQGTHLMRHFSRDHHNNLGPSSCEDGHPIQAALKRNQSLGARQPQELVQRLRGAGPELRALFVGLAPGGDLRVPFSVLSEEVGAIAEAWGFERSTVDHMLRSERLLGTGGKVPDDSGTLHIRYAEFMMFLETRDDPVLRVMSSVKCQCHSAKQVFHQLLDQQQQQQQQQHQQEQQQQHQGQQEQELQHQQQQQPPSAEGPAAPPTPAVPPPLDDSGPKVSLALLRESLLALALEAGSGWAVSTEDMALALTPAVFLPASSALTQEQQPPAAGLPPSDLQLSWPTFINQALHLLNR